MKRALDGTRGATSKAGDDAGKSYGQGFQKSLDSAMSGVKAKLAQTGRDAGKAFGDSFNAEIKKSTDKTFKDLEKRSEQSGKSAGAGFRKGFVSSLGDLGGALSGSFRDLERAAGESGQRSSKAFVGEFQRNTASQFSGVGDTVMGAIEGSIRPRAAKLPDVVFAPMRDGADRHGRSSGTAYGNSLISSLLAKMRGGASSVFSLFDRSAGDAGGRSGESFGARFDRVSRSSVGRSAVDLTDTFTKLYARLGAAGTAALGAVGAIGALVGSLVPVAGALAQISTAAFGALGALGALAQGGIAVGIAFKGVFSAISAGAKAANADTDVSQAGVLAAARRITDARKRISEQQITNDKNALASERRIADARDKIKQQQITNNRRIADAAQKVRSAENSLASAQRDAKAAQDALNGARKTASERLEDLAFDLEGAGLAERRAMLNLEDAEEALAKVSGQAADSTERREAQLAYEEAALAAKVAVDRHEDLAEAKEAADKAGIEGSKEVLDAQDKINSALEAEEKAEKAVADARADAARVAADGARDLAKARENLRRITEDAAAAEAKGNRDLAKAREALTRAMQDAARAEAAANKAANAEAEAFRKEMEKLSPSAQAFVREMLSLRDRMNEFKKVVQEPFFDKFNKPFADMVDELLPRAEVGLKRTSEIMGEMAATLADRLTVNAGLFSEMLRFNNEILSKFTEKTSTGNSAVGNLADGLLRLGLAIQPVTRMFADWIVSLTESFAAMTDSGDKVDALGQKFLRAGEIIGDIGGIMAAVWEAAGPAIEEIMSMLHSGLSDLRQTAEDNIEPMSKYFMDVLDNLRPLGRIVREVTKMFIGLGADKSIGEMFSILEEGVPALESIVKEGSEAGPALARLAVSVAELLAAFAETGALDVFFDTLTSMADALKDAFSSEAGQVFLRTITPILAVMKALSLAFMGVNLVSKLILGSFLKVGGVVASLFGKFATFGRILVFIKPTLIAIGAAIGAISWPVVAVVAAVAALIAIFVALYKNNEGFRDFVDGIVEKVKELVGGIIDWIKELWSKFTDFLGRIKDSWDGIWNGIVDVWNSVWEGIQDAWDSIGAPLFDLIKRVIGFWWKVIKGYFNLVKSVFKAVWKFIQRAWDEVGKPVFDTIKSVVEVWFDILFGKKGVFTKIKGVITEVWKWIQKKWNEYGQPAIDFVMGAFQFLWDSYFGEKGLFTRIKGVISDVFGWIQKKWDQYGQPALDIVTNAFDKLKNILVGKDGKSGVFGVIKNAFGNLWDGLWNTAKKGLGFLFDKINSFVIKPLNVLISPFTDKKIKDLPTFADGGYVKGPGGPRDDKVTARLSNGEYVMKSSTVKRVGKQNMEQFNKTGQLPPGVGGWGFLESVGDALKGVPGKVVDWAKQTAARGLGQLYTNIIEPLLPGIRSGGGFFGGFAAGWLKKLGDTLVNWGKKKDEENPAYTSGGGGMVPAYKGPPGGWDYPLSRRYPGKNWYGHNPRNAVDIASPTGTPVRAASAGVVYVVKDLGNSSYGKYIKIAHNRGVSTVYAHLSSFRTSHGRAVKTGQVIGLSGNTGGSSGPHLHFELNPSSSTISAMSARGVKLATGGTVRATPGGVMSLLAEGGKHERVEPLDSQGLSTRDYAIIDAVAQRVGGGGGSGATSVRVFIGERELTDIVRYEVRDGERTLARNLSIGRRGR